MIKLKFRNLNTHLLFNNKVIIAISKLEIICRNELRINTHFSSM
jgi:hypothetical protein